MRKFINYLKAYKFDLFMLLLSVIIGLSIFERPKGISERIKTMQTFSDEKVSNMSKEKGLPEKITQASNSSTESAEEDEKDRTLIALRLLFKEKIQTEEKDITEEKVTEPSLSEIIFGNLGGSVKLLGITGEKGKPTALLLDHRGQIWSLKKGSRLEGGALVVDISPTSLLLSYKGKKRELKLYEKRQISGTAEVLTQEPKYKGSPSKPFQFEPEILPQETEDQTLPQDEKPSPQERLHRRSERFFK